MSKSALLGFWRHLLPIPRRLWQKQVRASAQRNEGSLAFMTPAHHQVRNYVVREIPRVGRPLPPAEIAQALGLPLAQVVEILAELEAHLTFLYRNPAGEVEWAYPVTAAHTPHRLHFSTGESIYAAWAVDAIATPFVQGRLRGEYLVVQIETECAHCHQPLRLEVDSELKCKVLTPGAEPRVFVPTVNFSTLKDPSIVDAFWRRSVFFWSEEHVQASRHREGGVPGAYLTLDQTAHAMRQAQSALFGFPMPEDEHPWATGQQPNAKTPRAQSSSDTP